jgi:Nif-specific regulatory protein
VVEVSREPMFLPNLRSTELAREEINYVCVPILLNQSRRAGRGFRFKADLRPHGEVPRRRRLADGSVDSDSTRHRCRARAAPRGKHPLKSELRERYDFSNGLGTSGPMRRLRAGVAGGGTDTTVLIRGESGTGRS